MTIHVRYALSIKVCVISTIDVATLQYCCNRQAFEPFSAGVGCCHLAHGAIQDVFCCTSCKTCQGCLIMTKVTVVAYVIICALSILGGVQKWPQWSLTLLNLLQTGITLLRTDGKDHAKAVDACDRF